jgi:phytoene synthase
MTPTEPDIADPERALALSYAPLPLRPAIAALWALDMTLADIVRAARDPMIGQLRLTWWHEALVRLDSAAPPAQPVLQALAATLLPRGVTGTALAGMIDGWEALLDPDPLDDAALAAFAGGRGRGMFTIAAQALGLTNAVVVEEAGEGWALADLGRHLHDRDAARRAYASARQRFAGIDGYRWPVAARALGALTMLARRDAMRGPDRQEPLGAPVRVARMLWHRLSGR